MDSAFSTPASGAKLLSRSPADGSAGVPARRQPWWYGPRRLLALFCYIMFLCYADNGLLASNGVTGTASAESGGEGGLTVAPRCCALFAAVCGMPRAPGWCTLAIRAPTGTLQA